MRVRPHQGYIGSLVLLTSLVLTAPAAAQDATTGAIAGRVADPAGKGIAGAVIVAVSEAGPRTAVTDEQGDFLLPYVKPGNYSVRVEAPGGFNSAIQNDVVVGLNQRTTLSFTLEPGKVETITITGKSPLVDTTSASSGTNIDYEEFANSVPLGRAFTETYAIASGVVSGVGTGMGNYSINGSSGLENSYLIDGVNVTNTGFGGVGILGDTYGSLSTGVTSEFLDEVQVKTAGFEAEYGQALGGIINTIVKSGTNDFKGSVAWYASPEGLRGSPTLVGLEKGNSNTLERGVNDLAFSVGGPIKKDKLFYFLAYNPVMTVERRRATSNPNPAFAAASAGVLDYNGNPVFDEAANPNAFGVTELAFPSARGDLTRDRISNNYAFKLSAQMTPNQLLELTSFGDRAEGETGPQRQEAPLFTDFSTGGGESTIKYHSDNQALKWNAVLSPRLFMEAMVAHHEGRLREDSGVEAAIYSDLRHVQEFTRGATQYQDPGGGGLVAFEQAPVNPLRGGVGYITNQDDEITTYQVKLTTILGKHEVKYGVEYNDISFRSAASYTGPSFNVNFGLTDGSGAPLDADGDGIQDAQVLSTIGGGVVNVLNNAADPGGGTVGVAYDTPNIFRVVRARLSPVSPATTSKEYSGFIQDTWSIHPRLTLKAGVRFTNQSLQGAGEFSLNIGGSTTNYEPTGYTFTGNVAPRIGLIWDVKGDGRSRAWVNWGRYFERVPGDLAVRGFSNEVTLFSADYANRDLSMASQATAPATTCSDGLGGTNTCVPYAGVAVFGIQPTDVIAGVKLPYEDEISGGYAFEVTPTSSLEVRAIFRSQGRVLEDAQANSAEQFLNYYFGANFGYPYDPFGGTLAAPVSTTFPAAPFGSDQLSNPGTSRVPQGGVFGFPEPKRDFKSFELIYTRRFQDQWSMLASYRYSRLRGNYEGLFRNDNGQADPNYLSVYDFPDSPLMSGVFAEGALPVDVAHVLHIFPSYQFRNRLRVGANFSWASGIPRTSMLAHPVYQNGGEIPGINPVYAYWIDVTGDGAADQLRTTKGLAAALSDPQAVTSPFLKSYTPVERGNLGRTAGVTTLDLHADYPLAIGRTELVFMADVFNLFNDQEPLRFDDNIEITAGVPDPDFLKPIEYQSPRTWRIATRWNF